MAHLKKDANGHLWKNTAGHLVNDCPEEPPPPPLPCDVWDDFNRADNASLGPNWTECGSGPLEIANNHCAFQWNGNTGANQYARAVNVNPVGSNDHQVTVTLGNWLAGGSNTRQRFNYVCGRHTANDCTGNYYAGYIQSHWGSLHTYHRRKILKQQGGWSTLAEDTADASLGEWNFKVDGSDLTWWKTGFFGSALTANDSDIASGQYGGLMFVYYVMTNGGVSGALWADDFCMNTV